MSEFFPRPTAFSLQPPADPRCPPAAGSRRAGLTVLELVSALALFVVVLGTLMVALNSATDIWSRNTAKTRAQQRARQALDLLATDLASAIAQAPANPASAAASGSGGASDSEELFFIVENAVAQKSGLYFVRQRSPLESIGARARSLELVAYRWTTNGLARYTRPVTTDSESQIEPSVSEQLKEFKQDTENVVSNILAPSIVLFVPYIYQPLKAPPLADSEPAEPLNADSETFNLVDLPDYVDVHFATADREASSGAGLTNYITRRITLPAAQASRLP